MKKPKILIVDDSKPILRLLEVILQKKFDVSSFTSAFLGINWLEDGNYPDLVISDIEMPNINGVEFISHLSNSTYYENIPILILSGYNKDEITKQSERFKSSGYITKPFDPIELIEKIDTILKNKACPKFSL